MPGIWLVILAAAAASAPFQPPPQRTPLFAAGSPCSVPLLQMQIPSGVKFHILEKGVDLSQWAKMPQVQVPDPPCKP